MTLNQTRVSSLTEFERQLDECGDKIVVVEFIATWGKFESVFQSLTATMTIEHPDVLYLQVDIEKTPV